VTTRTEPQLCRLTHRQLIVAAASVCLAAWSRQDRAGSEIGLLVAWRSSIGCWKLVVTKQSWKCFSDFRWTSFQTSRTGGPTAGRPAPARDLRRPHGEDRRADPRQKRSRFVRAHGLADQHLQLLFKRITQPSPSSLISFCSFTSCPSSQRKGLAVAEPAPSSLRRGLVGNGVGLRRSPPIADATPRVGVSARYLTVRCASTQ